jgi:hypothetical protein
MGRPSNSRWASRTPGQEARNQVRKERVSLTPEMKMGVLLGRSPAGWLVFDTWAFVVCLLACRSEAQARR